MNINENPKKIRKLLSDIQILCARFIFNLFKNTYPLNFKHLNFSIFRLLKIISTQTIYINKKLYTLSRFAMLKAIPNLFKWCFFIHLYSYMIKIKVFTAIKWRRSSIITKIYFTKSDTVYLIRMFV